MKQLTLDETIQSELSVTDRRVLTMLKKANTPSQTSQKLKVPRSTVHRIVRRLEKAKLIRKKFATNYNILYDVVEDAGEQKKKGELPETPVRVHNIAMKFKIERQNDKLSVDERAGWVRTWKMRGGIKWHAYGFQGKTGEPDFTVTATPKTLIVRMDKGQKIRAASSEEAENKGYQLAASTIKKFCAKQREFGVIIEAASTGKVIVKAHAGLAIRTGGPLDSETRIPGTWRDKSQTELGPGFDEFEMHTDHSLLTPLEKGVLAVAGIPEMIRSVIDPLGENVSQVKAMMQGEITMQRQYEQMMKFMTSVLTEMEGLRQEIRELKGK